MDMVEEKDVIEAIKQKQSKLKLIAPVIVGVIYLLFAITIFVMYYE